MIYGGLIRLINNIDTKNIAKFFSLISPQYILTKYVMIINENVRINASQLSEDACDMQRGIAFSNLEKLEIVQINGNLNFGIVLIMKYATRPYNNKLAILAKYSAQISVKFNILANKIPSADNMYEQNGVSVV